MIDDIDIKIMNIIQNDCKIPNVEIARRLGMAPSAMLERFRRLEEKGYIQGYEARLNAPKLGMGLLAFVFVRTNDRGGAYVTAQKIARIPEVLEVHDVAGEDCYVVKLRARDTDHLSRLMKTHFGKMKSILSTRTTIVLETIKETGKLPLSEDNIRKKNDAR